jgi:HlyD family secretion protein
MSNPSPRKTGRGRLRLLMILVVVGGSVGGWFYYQHVQAQNVAARVALESLKPVKRVQVHSLGRLEPAGTILQLSPKSGNEGAVIEKLLVNEGDDVSAGATLAILDNQARRQAALEEAQARLAAAEARLDQIKAGAKAGDIEAQQAAVNMAEAQSKVAARDLNRANELHAKQAISVELVDQRQWEFDRLQLEQRRATGTLQSLKEIRDVDVAVAEKDIIGARAAVARTQADLDASVVTAPVSGRILKIHTHPGEKLNERGVLEMGDVLRMQAVAEVFEADVSLIQNGMKAEIRIDSSGYQIEGTVIEIGNLVSRKVVLTNDPVSDTDARVVEVRIDLNSDQIESVSRLANARVEVTILLEGPEPQSTEAAQGSVQTISHQSAR